MRLVARTMAGAQITDAEPARMTLRRVTPAAMREGFWTGKEPSTRKEGWRDSAMTAVETAASHLREDHLAAEWQVGEGASPRLDAGSKNRPPGT